MEVTLEDMTEEEEFDSDTVYGKEHMLNVTCSMARDFKHLLLVMSAHKNLTTDQGLDMFFVK